MTAREVAMPAGWGEPARPGRRERLVALAQLRWSARDAARRARVEGLPTPQARAEQQRAMEQTGGDCP